MAIYFITGNKGKLEEVQSIIPHVQAIDLDLPEIQDLDPRKVIQEKLNHAKKHHDKELFCEDTSLYIECLNNLPGPLIKWFLQSLGIQGIYELVSKHDNNNAIAKTIIGYSNKEKTEFFEGIIPGKIVSPKGSGFGWDAIFQPDGHNMTFGEMDQDKKNMISMRKKALEKLKEFLDENNNKKFIKDC